MTCPTDATIDRDDVGLKQQKYTASVKRPLDHETLLDPVQPGSMAINTLYQIR